MTLAGLELTRPIIGLDLETTNADPQTARIVEIGFKKIHADGRMEAWESFINPGMPIPPESTAVHGITDAMVADAPTFAQLASSLPKGFRDCDYAGYNIRFDLRVLRAELARHGHEWDYAGAGLVDAFRIWQVKSPRRLDDAVEEFCGRQRGASHRALVDVEDALDALSGQRTRWPDLPTSVAALHELCFPDQLDPDGKIVWVQGEAVFNIGKHKGRRLRDVPADYFAWMQRDNFSPFIKAIAKEAQAGRFPIKEVPSCASSS